MLFLWSADTTLAVSMRVLREHQASIIVLYSALYNSHTPCTKNTFLNKRYALIMQGCQNYFAIYPSTRLESPNIYTSKIRRKSEVASDTEYRIKNGVANLHFHLIDCWPRILVVGDRNNAVLARSQDTAAQCK